MRSRSYVPSPDKRDYRHVGIERKPDDDKRTSQELNMAGCDIGRLWCSCHVRRATVAYAAVSALQEGRSTEGIQVHVVSRGS